MSEDVQRRRRNRIRLAWALGVLLILLAVIVVPPLVSMGRYRGRITRLISTSLGRPVHLSSVELRLFPRPGFVLTNLTVDEDPAYGSEPVLHANTVTASIRLLSLWRGPEISSISVDEASLNLVHTMNGHWNVESLFRSAAGQGVGTKTKRRQVPLPYLEATESRINVKEGAEKLPYSLINADLSFWQDDPGHWRIRLRAQPARTDLSIDPADTGIVRLEADLHRAAELRQVPMHVDLEWSEAQLGQLTRLVVGSDAGWRGNLTGELHLDGTPDNARIRTRLRAAGVHRAEFAPAEPMDFDAACAFLYRYSTRAVEGLECNSPLGDGRVRLTGSLPGGSAPPTLTVELERLPVDAALDALRTVRNGISPDLAARGTVSGKIVYAHADAAATAAAKTRRGTRRGNVHAQPPGPLNGRLTIQGLELTGGGLAQPLRVPKVVLEASSYLPDQNSEPQAGPLDALTATATIPGADEGELTVTSRLTLAGYQVSLSGPASLQRLRELAKVAGLGDSTGLNELSGDAASLDLTASGPWIAPDELPGTPDQPGPDQVSGTVGLHNVAWKTDFLANPMEIAQATIHAEAGQLRWDPVAFAYGPVKGTGSLTLPLRCEPQTTCLPKFALQFGALDTGSLEAAILGARESSTLLSELIARLSPSRSPSWPKLEGTLEAGSLVLGPVTLKQATAALRILPDGAEVTALEAGLLGGQMHATGKLRAAGAQGNPGPLPAYSFEGRFDHVSPMALGQLLGMHWAGGQISGDGNVDLAGYTAKDLAGSASGTVRFDWLRGSVSATGVPEPGSAAAIPAALARFDRWTAEAAIAKGVITLQENTIQRGARQASVAASAAFAEPMTVTFARPEGTQTAKR